MAVARSLGAVVGNATQAVASNLAIALPVVLVPAAMLALLDHWAVGHLHIDLSKATQEEQMLPLMLAWTGTSLVVEILWGPIFSAVAIYLGRVGGRNEPTSFYNAMNFALGRYPRLFLWHAAVTLLVQIGFVLICVPGVICALVYAFVDPVVCLEKEKWPLTRSTKLTRGRRQRIFALYAPIFIFQQVKFFLDVYALEHGVVWLWVSYAGYSLLMFLLATALYFIYEERTTRRDPGTPVEAAILTPTVAALDSAATTPAPSTKA